MFKTCVYRWPFYLAGLVVILSLSSCFNSRKAQKELAYLQGKLDTLPNLTVASKEAIIQKGDLLSIVVYSDNFEASAVYNQQQGHAPSGSGGTTSGNVGGYLVAQDGNIYFQSLGPIHAEGLTRKELADVLVKKFVTLDLLKNPYADIRFLNFKFTVLGEVNKPGTFSVPQENISILEMLGLAGDLTMFGRRDNVLIIRETNGKREFGRLDLRKANIFQSPYFYLQQNDVVWVEPNNKKATLNDQTTLRNLSIVTGLASLASVAVVLINFFRR